MCGWTDNRDDGDDEMLQHRPPLECELGASSRSHRRANDLRHTSSVSFMIDQGLRKQMLANLRSIPYQGDLAALYISLNPPKEELPLT